MKENRAVKLSNSKRAVFSIHMVYCLGFSVMWAWDTTYFTIIDWYSAFRMMVLLAIVLAIFPMWILKLGEIIQRREGKADQLGGR